MAFNYLKVIVIIFLLKSDVLTKASSIEFGKCPVGKAMENFDFKKYEGIWYYVEVKNDPTVLYQDCLAIHYQNLNGSSFEANTALRLLGKNLISPGNGTLIPLGTNQFYSLVDSTALPITIQGLEIPQEFQLTYKYTAFILDTDYETYTIEWTCDPNGKLPGTYLESIWIATRTREYLPEVKEKVHNILEENGFDLKRLFEVDQTNCDDII